MQALISRCIVLTVLSTFVGGFAALFVAAAHAGMG
jgi:hypothetical protein